MKRLAPTNGPAVKSHVGTNWKLIRNLFIIAGLLIAISITWEIRRESRTKRERANREAIEKQKEARQKALAEAQALGEARKREAERAALNSTPPPAEKPEPTSHGNVQAETVKKPDAQAPVQPHNNNPEPELPPGITNLNNKARDLVISADRKRDEQLAENTKKLTWDLDSYLRSLPKSEQMDGITNVNRLKNQIENNRVPDSILQSDDVAFTRRMEDIATFALRKQKEIDQAFIAEAAKIQTAYVRKISDALKEAEAAGQQPLSSLLKRTIDDSTNLGAWLRSLGVDDAAP